MRNSDPPTVRELNDSFHKTVTSNKPIILSQRTSKLFAKAKQDIEAHISGGKLRVSSGSNVKVIPLGTGSALPTKYRNGLSHLLSLFCQYSISPSILYPRSDPQLGKYSFGRR